MKTLWFLALLLVTATAHAQDCGGVNAGGTCVPPDVAMPSYHQQAPQPPPQRWVDHYGAMATNEPGNVLGTATNMQSESEAIQSAIADCQTKGGGSSCTSLLSYRNGCAVLLVGDKFFNAASAATIEKATQSGMKICTANGNTNCHVYYFACSFPISVQ